MTWKRWLLALALAGVYAGFGKALDVESPHADLRALRADAVTTANCAAFPAARCPTDRCDIVNATCVDKCGGFSTQLCPAGRCVVNTTTLKCQDASCNAVPYASCPTNRCDKISSSSTCTDQCTAISASQCPSRCSLIQTTCEPQCSAFSASSCPILRCMIPGGILSGTTCQDRPCAEIPSGMCPRDRCDTLSDGRCGDLCSAIPVASCPARCAKLTSTCEAKCSTFASAECPAGRCTSTNGTCQDAACATIPSAACPVDRCAKLSDGTCGERCSAFDAATCPARCDKLQNGTCLDPCSASSAQQCPSGRCVVAGNTCQPVSDCTTIPANACPINRCYERYYGAAGSLCFNTACESFNADVCPSSCQRTGASFEPKLCRQPCSVFTTATCPKEYCAVDGDRCVYSPCENFPLGQCPLSRCSTNPISSSFCKEIATDCNQFSGSTCPAIGANGSRCEKPASLPLLNECEIVGSICTNTSAYQCPSGCQRATSSFQVCHSTLSWD